MEKKSNTAKGCFSKVNKYLPFILILTDGKEIS